ncbi:unnamed protein product [Meloidogyne enterolobii]|uniref:Uncharacterized protein n=1 Tax=Meloidogyne enterolobii TaxID=390850 RepID=A0ACB0Y5L8_MELEN
MSHIPKSFQLLPKQQNINSKCCECKSCCCCLPCLFKNNKREEEEKRLQNKIGVKLAKRSSSISDFYFKQQGIFRNFSKSFDNKNAAPLAYFSDEEFKLSGSDEERENNFLKESLKIKRKQQSLSPKILKRISKKWERPHNFGQISKYPPNEEVRKINSIFELEKRKWLEKREEINKRILEKRKEILNKEGNEEVSTSATIKLVKPPSIIKRRKSRAERIELIEEQLQEINNLMKKKKEEGKNKEEGEEEELLVDDEFEKFKQKHSKLKNIIKATKSNSSRHEAVIECLKQSLAKFTSENAFKLKESFIPKTAPNSPQLSTEYFLKSEQRPRAISVHLYPQYSSIASKSSLRLDDTNELEELKQLMLGILPKGREIKRRKFEEEMEEEKEEGGNDEKKEEEEEEKYSSPGVPFSKMRRGLKQMFYGNTNGGDVGIEYQQPPQPIRRPFGSAPPPLQQIQQTPPLQRPAGFLHKILRSGGVTVDLNNQQQQQQPSPKQQPIPRPRKVLPQQQQISFVHKQQPLECSIDGDYAELEQTWKQQRNGKKTMIFLIKRINILET